MSRDINTILELWAQWVHRGGHSGGYQSVLHKMMVTGCLISSGGGGYSAEIYTIEADIELCLLNLVKSKPNVLNLMRVNCLRYEYDAKSLGWPPGATQTDKAHRIGISLRTYKRHLKYCKDHVIESLKK
jgi:hypothetical protein